MQLSNSQTTEFARLIYKDIKPYIEAHRAEFELFLERENAKNKEKLKDDNNQRKHRKSETISRNNKPINAGTL